MTDDDIEETPGSDSSARIDAARRDVERAHAKFSTDLAHVSSAGRTFTSSIVKGARPALIGVALVTGVALIVAVWRWRSTRPQRAFHIPTAHSPSGELGRAVVMTLASMAGRHLVSRLVALSEATPRPSDPSPVTARGLGPSSARPVAPYSNGKHIA